MRSIYGQSNIVKEFLFGTQGELARKINDRHKIIQHLPDCKTDEEHKFEMNQIRFLNKEINRLQKECSNEYEATFNNK